jgi:hypothetical protein
LLVGVIPPLFASAGKDKSGVVTMFAEDIEKSFASFFRIDAVVSKVGGLANLTTVLTNILA